MNFLGRHISNINKKNDIVNMLNKIGISSIDHLINHTGIEHNFNSNNSNYSLEKSTLNKIRSNGLSEKKALDNLKKMLDKNVPHTSYLGMGYFNSDTPSPIKRHILQNPQWYTAYTPYQAEISQGRLESQYNYQTLIRDLTGLPVSNASLLDEASAAGEAINLSHGYYKKKRDTILVSSNIHPHILSVMDTRASNLGINIELVDFSTTNFNYNKFDPEQISNIIFQYPDTYGEISVPYNYLKLAKDNNILTTSINDLLSLTKLVSPGELGIDISLGSCQRFGIPLWYGGPHPAFFAVNHKLIRYLPGRIIGKSTDTQNNPAFRLALQTREQHIKRANATSNICTSQSLLTNVVSFYSIYHGPSGLKQISQKINNKAKYFVNNIPFLKIKNKNFYDTISVIVDDPDDVIKYLDKSDILVRKSSKKTISIGFDEAIEYKDIDILIDQLYRYSLSKDRYISKKSKLDSKYHKTYKSIKLSQALRRSVPYLQDTLFNKYNSETELLRYMTSLVKKDYTLCDGMIPLGSCTMKLNASYQLEPLLWNTVTNIHPYVPLKYSRGYREMIDSTGDYLKEITGFSNISFQPNSGATGEYSGLLSIKKFRQLNPVKKNELRDICLIPNSAHGTNFASASIANLDIKTFDDSHLDNIETFDEYVKQFKDSLLCLMITYPNTNGVFQKNIKEIIEIIKKYNGMVYLDGANMNALVGLTNISKLGADICHLNLHKTFCIPHGGGGPGMGPILCNNSLAPYLPSNTHQISKHIDTSCGNVSASEWSSASLLTIPYLYISCMGMNGLKNASKFAILNSNYLKSCLEPYYTIKDVNKNGVVGHEFIIDTTEFKHLNITENDIAKRLMDYSFHPPTMSWPRAGVLMFEPTESESKQELDRLVIAMKQIRYEIQEIEDGIYDKEVNVLKKSPHTFSMISNWEFPYSPDKAFYPCDYLYNKKFNIPVSRVDDLSSDKLLLKNHK